MIFLIFIRSVNRMISCLFFSDVSHTKIEQTAPKEKEIYVGSESQLLASEDGKHKEERGRGL